MADIPLPTAEKEDIYSLGFGKSLQRGITDNSTGVVYDTIENSLNTGSVLSGGNLNLKTLSIGSLTRQVAPGDDIQAAIDAVSREGGGTVQLLAKTYNPTFDIEIKQNVRLQGAGVGVTIIDFVDGAFSVKVSGNAASYVQNWAVENITILNSTATAGLDVLFGQNFELSNLLVSSCAGVGMRLRGVDSFICSNVESSDNTGNNWLFGLGASSVSNRDYTLINCVADRSGVSGFVIDSTGSSSVAGNTSYSLINCSATQNVVDGFLLSGDVATSNGFSRFLGCRGISNGVNDFNIDQGSYMTFIGCSGNGAGSGFALDMAAESNNIIGFVAPGGLDINDTSDDGNTYIGCGVSGQNSTIFNSFTEEVMMQSNDGASVPQDRKIVYMQNTSGAVIPAGSVVVSSSVADGDEITTTSTNSDNKVLGVLVEAKGNNSFGKVLVSGKTTLLIANNSASSISIGDFLSTYSHAYYAKKAVTGETVFAIALEAPTTSTAVIDALLISPRLI